MFRENHQLPCSHDKENEEGRLADGEARRLLLQEYTDKQVETLNVVAVELTDDWEDFLVLCQILPLPDCRHHHTPPKLVVARNGSLSVSENWIHNTEEICRSIRQLAHSKVHCQANRKNHKTVDQSLGDLLSRLAKSTGSGRLVPSLFWGNTCRIHVG